LIETKLYSKFQLSNYQYNILSYLTQILFLTSIFSLALFKERVNILAIILNLSALFSEKKPQHTSWSLNVLVQWFDLMPHKMDMYLLVRL